MLTRLDDVEIYELAYNVLIVNNDLFNELYYSKQGGQLKLCWKDSNEVNASATSYNSFGEPPNHTITINYGLVKQLYIDSINYVEYLKSGIDNDFFEYVWKDDNHLDKLLEYASEDATVNYIFIAAITWVYFHELGHLTQEHGFIRGKEIGQVINDIIECDANQDSEFDSNMSLIFHVTEIAADYFATSWCVFDIIRQFTEDKREVAIRIIMSGIAIILHRFNGVNNYEVELTPKGSHPKPFVRLELLVPIIFEKLSSINTPERASFVKAAALASTTVSVFWLRQNAEIKGVPEHYIIEGIRNRPGVLNYLKPIITTWDRILPTILANNKFDMDIQIMRFSEELKEIVFTNDRSNLEL